MTEGADNALSAADAEREIRRLRRALARREEMLAQLQGVQKSSSQLLSSVLNELTAEKQRSEALLRNILPEDVIRRLEAAPDAIADAIESATVVFVDFVGFTTRAARMTASELVAALNEKYSAFDAAAQRTGIEKIKTIGDAYLAVSGLDGQAQNHADVAAEFALTILDLVQNEPSGSPLWPVRIGLHTGPLTAGVIGTHKFAYDIWGDTVNVASRVQSACDENEVLVTEATARLLSPRYTTRFSRNVALKGRGRQDVYAVSRSATP